MTSATDSVRPALKPTRPGMFRITSRNNGWQLRVSALSEVNGCRNSRILRAVNEVKLRVPPVKA